MSDTDDDAPGPAERRLDQHLELLRDEAPEPGSDLVHRVTRRARWQSAVRRPLRVVGMLAAAVLDGLGTVFGVRRGQTR